MVIPSLGGKPFSEAPQALPKAALLHDPPRRQHDDRVHHHQGRKPVRWFLVRS